ncbi:MAG: thioredoxin domain-containing protein [Saprospiraceae bacterium]|nr:thioredoxin domain-containing protein [Saprospiraceae bacterium]
MGNQLKHSQSPYLLQHQDNPVEWLIWSKETLNRAKIEDKLILVSIGYSTCHWCHVMAHECFENAEIAVFMNKHFINIKIDREERPDLDHYFMTSIQQLGIQGGWPLNCFLTPDLKVFYGGTYFPPSSKYGRIAWPDLLAALVNSFQVNRSKLENQASELNRLTNQQLTQINSPEKDSTIHLVDVFSSFNSFLDLDFGGFGFGQKFPNTMVLELLITYNRYHPHTELRHFIRKSISKMCYGGMYDHVDGGFFRYTVDREWKVPHFEKMAYDHALIIACLSKLFIHNEFSFVQYFIRNSINFWERELMGSNGLFYSALDADSEGIEGIYYLWNRNEIEVLLKTFSNEFFKYAELEEMHGSEKKVLNVLPFVDLPYSTVCQKLDSLNSAFEDLKRVRNQRVKPSTDTKQILAWNALINIAYCDAYLAGIENNYRISALHHIEKMLKLYVVDDRIFSLRRICVHENQTYQEAFLEDYAYLAFACWKVYQISADNKYLKKSIELVQFIHSKFDINNYVYSNIHSEHEDSMGSSYELQDSSIPNPNAILAELLYYHFLIDSSIENRDRFEKMRNAAFQNMAKNYFSHASWIKLHEELMSQTKIIKAKDLETVAKFTKGMNRLNFIYIYTNELKSNVIQLCNGETCMMPCSDINDFKNQLNFSE